MKRQTRSQPDLLEATRVVFYEVQQLQNVLLLWKYGQIPDQARMNQCVEAFAIHSRSLIFFLYDDNPRKDDIVACDFFAEPSQWVSLRPSQPQILEDTITRAGKRIAHLTYDRLYYVPTNNSWPFQEIYDALLKSLSVFRDNIPQSVLSDELRKAF